MTRHASTESRAKLARWGGLLLVALAVLAVFASSATARGSDHQTKRFKPVKRTERTLVFRPRQLDAGSVVRAKMRFKLARENKVVRRSRRVPARRVRRALERRSLLKVRRPRRARGGRLLVKIRRPQAPPSATSCTFGTFSATNLPGACWRPYADTAPWNRGIPASPRLRSDSRTIVNTVVGFGGPDKIAPGTSDDWFHPIYFSQPTDPVFTLHCTESSWGECEIEGHQIRIPQAARAASGGDAHLTVIDQAAGWEYDLYKYCYEGCSSSSTRTLPAGGGDIYFRWGGRTRIGTPESDGLESNATAAWFGLAAGVIRPAELEAGQINHALFMTVKCTNGTSVWPAGSGAGASCSDKSDAPAMGQHFMLDMTEAEIDALSVPSWKKTILKAMARYGMFVGDTGGTGWGVQFESSASYTSFGHQDPWARLGAAWGLPQYGGKPVFDLREGVDWSRLQVVEPCVAQGTC
jgi:hypothetical protein